MIPRRGVNIAPSDRNWSFPGLAPELYCSMKAFDKLDYRRFDHLGSDSDEDSVEETYPVDSLEETVNNVARSQDAAAWGPANPSRHPGSPQIKTHPSDHSCPTWVYADPDTWEAPPDPCELELLQVGTSHLCCHYVPYSG